MGVCCFCWPSKDPELAPPPYYVSDLYPSERLVFGYRREDTLGAHKKIVVAVSETVKTITVVGKPSAVMSIAIQLRRKTFKHCGNLIAVFNQYLKPCRTCMYPRASEEHVPLSSNQGAAASFSGRLLVDTNLDISNPDTYIPPPAPNPSNDTLDATQIPPVAQEIRGDKNNASLHATNSNSTQKPVTGDNLETSTKLEELKEPELKVQTDLELDSAKGSEIEPPQLEEVEPIKLVEEEEDDCPICLEEYDDENPKLTTECDHHYHLACILEWMERRETCPMCEQVMVLNP
ncbi:hypothetical protein RIF29_34455 [Crotalaria pallida]|uniref:RING-type E3 ubiquitin transferase n=1 Tax=Crotalaria pallida TaxID=3830 RepID=A0AAN9HUP4_CROPI